MHVEKKQDGGLALFDGFLGPIHGLVEFSAIQIEVGEPERRAICVAREKLLKQLFRPVHVSGAFQHCREQANDYC